MNNDQLDFEGVSDEEIRAFRAFSKTYEVQHPAPQRDQSNLTWEFWAAMVTSLAAMTLAAFRTASAFLIASHGNYAEAISAVLAIEGSVVLFAIQRAKRANKTDDTSSQWGLWVAFAISMLAGLFQSMGLLSADNLFTTFLSWTLVLFMGVGATVIAWLGGDILGVHIVRLEAFRTADDVRYDNALRSWRANCVRSFRGSGEQAAMNERKSVRYGANGSLRSEQGRVRSPERSQRTNGERKGVVLDLLNTYFANTSQIPGVSEVARKLAEAEFGTEDGFERFKGYVSEIRKDWMQTIQKG
jgi:hypothetical protein